MPTPEHDAYLAKITGMDVAKARSAAQSAGARTRVVEEEDGSISLLGPEAKSGGGHHHEHHAKGHGHEHGKQAAPAADVPNPIQPDCKIVHGKIDGPKNHVLCGTHGHVLDTDAGRVIANSVDEYKANYGKGGHKAAGHGGKPKGGAPDPRATNQMFVDSAKNIVTVAQANAQAFAHAIVAGCDQFGAYAAGKLNARHGHIQLGDLIPALAGAIMGPYASAIGTKAQNSVAQSILGALNSTMQDKIAAATSGAPQEAKDPAAAIAAIAHLTAAAKTGAGGIVPGILGPIQKICGSIQSAANTQLQLTQDEEAFMQPFTGASNADIGAGLITYCIPTPARSAKLQGDIYSRMVATFDTRMGDARMGHA
jgi:hypothetical protein